LKFAYKNYPTPNGESDYCATLQVQISNPVTHSPPSKRFEALIDSGASRCIFHAGLGKGVGFNIEKGEVEETYGISGKPTLLYLHKISLYVAGHIITIIDGFSYDIPLAAVLGRRGFFDNFKVAFDASTNPLTFDLERIHKI
jgi:hypothetical protein